MIAKVLRHKTLKGFHGMVHQATLYRTGPSLLPQLFPADINKEWIQKSVRYVDQPWVNSLEDFDLVKVSIKYSEINEK